MGFEDVVMPLMKDVAIVIEALMGQGVAFICANCVHAWQGFSKEENGCHKRLDELMGRAPGVLPWCCGPGSGHGFPMYKGPLVLNEKRPDVIEFCFVCGGPTRYAVRTPERTLAICKQHYEERVWESKPGGRQNGGSGRQELDKALGEAGQDSGSSPEPVPVQ